MRARKRSLRKEWVQFRDWVHENPEARIYMLFGGYADRFGLVSRAAMMTILIFSSLMLLLVVIVQFSGEVARTILKLDLIAMASTYLAFLLLLLQRSTLLFLMAVPLGAFILLISLTLLGVAHISL